MATCGRLNCELLGEGVDTAAEFRVLRDMGIDLFHGYLFANPVLEALPVVSEDVWDALE